MDYTIKLHTGDHFTLKDADIDGATYVQHLNSDRVLFVNLGGIIVDKKVIAAIIPQPITKSKGEETE